LRWINIATCKIAYPQVAIGGLARVGNDLVTSFRHFINDFGSPLWVSTCATGCSTSISIDKQYSWKAWDVNSLALSRWIFLIE